MKNKEPVIQHNYMAFPIGLTLGYDMVVTASSNDFCPQFKWFHSIIKCSNTQSDLYKLLISLKAASRDVIN